MAASESGPKILTVTMLDATDEGIPVQINYRNSTAQKKIPNGHGITRISVVLQEEKISGVEFVTEKI